MQTNDQRNFSSFFGRLLGWEDDQDGLPFVKDGILLDGIPEKFFPESEEKSLFDETAFIDGFLEYLRAKGYSKWTIKGYQYDLKIMCQFAHARKQHPFEWTSEGMNQYMEWLKRERKNTSATIQRHVSSFSGFAKWAMRTQGVSCSWVLTVERPKKEVPSRCFDGWDFDGLREKLKKTADDDVVCGWTAIFLMTGVRVSEIPMLEVANRGLMVGKNGRFIPTDSWVIGAVIRHIAHNKKAWRASRGVVWKKVKGRFSLNPQELRHGYAQALIKQGVGLDEVARRLGVSLGAVGRYVQL